MCALSILNLLRNGENLRPKGLLSVDQKTQLIEESQFLENKLLFSPGVAVCVLLWERNGRVVSGRKDGGGVVSVMCTLLKEEE